jgi:hypothetical protein
VTEQPIDSAASSSPPASAACTVTPSPATSRTSTRSAAHNPHPFFSWLRRAPASDAIAQHFCQHYLQSSPICSCTLFPVYSSKVDLQPPTNPSARRFLQSLSHLCLRCIDDVCNDTPALAPCKQYWTRAMERDKDMYNLSNAAVHDSARFALFDKIMASPQEFDELDRFTFRRLVPTMGQLGWQLEEDGLHWSHRPSSKEDR